MHSRCREFLLRHVSDRVLLEDLHAEARRSADSDARLLARIAEFERRKLYLVHGYASMFRYCVQVLHFSGDVAYKRIQVARAAIREPEIFVAIAEGRVHMTGVLLLAPYLKRGNAKELLEAATHRTKLEIQEMLAARFPRPDVPTRIEPARVQQDLDPVAQPTSQHHAEGTAANTELLDLDPVAAAPAAAFVAPPPAPRPRVTPLAPERYALQLTMSKETHDLLRQAQDLLRHRIPSGDAADVLHEVPKLAIPMLERQKFAATEKPRGERPGVSRNPRRIPASIKREVALRDGKRCTFVSASGHRCEATGNLEFDHIVPIAKGGKSTAANLRLLCRAHNQYAAGETLGHGFMHEQRERARSAHSAPPPP